MNPNFQISGIHHITAIASSAAANLAFYENVLGLHLVKKTVNFDDPYTYHLYYGDSIGSPGTILTFFPWEYLPKGRTGAGMVASIAFSIPSDSIEYWHNRFKLHNIETRETERFGERAISFEDLHGLPLELIANSSALSNSTRPGSPIPPAYSIIGFHSATGLWHAMENTRFLLTDLMGMVPLGNEGNRYRFKMKNDEGRGHFLDAVFDARAENGRQGGGTVHHIAFRTPTYAEQKSWQKLLVKNGVSVTPIIDRKYFKSIYFREPGGVLFEIATDPPGFAIDEPVERLGRDLKLPEQYESMRAAIESRLPKLQPKMIRRYITKTGAADSR